MLARWWAFAVWALVVGSALFWGLRLFVKAPQAPAQTALADLGAGARGDLTRVFGPDPVAEAQAAEPEPVADTRFQLIGVVSPRGGPNSQGLALIAVDGKPARAFRVGSVVEGQTVLQSVQARGASLGPRAGAALVALTMAPPAAAATGSLTDTLPAGITMVPNPPQGMTRPTGSPSGPARQRMSPAAPNVEDPQAQQAGTNSPIER